MKRSGPLEFVGWVVLMMVLAGAYTVRNQRTASSEIIVIDTLSIGMVKDFSVSDGSLYMITATGDVWVRNMRNTRPPLFLGNVMSKKRFVDIPW